MNLGEINISKAPDESYSLLVKAVQITPNIRIIQGDEASLNMRLAILNEDNSESSFDIHIRYKEKYSIARLTPIQKDDWNRISDAQELVKKALTRYTLPNA